MTRWFAFVAMWCVAMAALSACSAAGDDGPVDLPAPSDVLPSPESLAAFGADPAWRYDANSYPALMDDALQGRALPHVQVSYTTDESVVPGHQFVASLFFAPSRIDAQQFWAAHGPETVYTRSIMLDGVPEADREEALRFARHTMSDQRPGESWAITCIAGKQFEGDNSDCGDLVVWVAWCNKVLELRISLDLEYRSQRVDAPLRDMVDSIRTKAGC